MRIVFAIFGLALTAVGALAALIVVDMFQHPRGMGAETLVGPIVGFVAAGLLFAGICSLYAAYKAPWKRS